ncbi:MAG TPA: HAMP domain-containing sensor histidine kinase [Candidatus Baltobacteraceae bacterium]|jgi:signal transduction histidine kinase|nr:HAMP domain-containing sensor histidine kinase [Candidatus Baltobacteraceae bacterium]
MATVEGSHESRTLQRLFEITQDILEARDIGPALDSIARGLSELYGFRYVSIVASEAAGGEMFRRVLIGFDPQQIEGRLGEHIPRAEVTQLLAPEYEVMPRCFYIPAERDQYWAHNIYVGESRKMRVRERPDAWHEHDSLTLVLADRDGEMIGYISVDGPVDGRVPTLDALREMQLFVNLVGLALGNARGHKAEVERRELLEATSRAQSEFFSLVSHEVRSPLAAIGGATGLLEQHFDSLTPERRTELLAVLGTSTARLSAIFEDFLLLSRMDAGKLTLRMETIDAIAVVDESVARIESQHPEREFRTLYLAPVPRVFGDEGRVVQVLANMLSNAAKYSTPESVIVVEIRPSGQSVTFSVKNEGPGVPESDRDKLFTRFGRISAESSDASIGLGLYICSELVSLMGGSIGYESEPNKVTTFWFSLPLAAE